MIAVDTNILVAALRSEYEHHERAAALVRELAEGGSPWALPWPCVHELLAVVTNPRIFREPLSTHHAADALDAFFESPTVRLIAEGPEYWSILRQLVMETKTFGPRIHDARIVAVCLAHGVTELWTADRDFSRFPTLRTRNPFVA